MSGGNGQRTTDGGTWQPRGIQHVGSFMFFSRWLQAPLYVGLIVAQAVFVWHFLVELWHLLHNVFVPGGKALTEIDIMLVVLGLVDVVMIANLLIMVIVGGYETFVSRIRLDDHPDTPEWLSHVNANVLKVKLATAIIGISSIHLLKSFIEADHKPWQALMWQTIIHCAFLVSAVTLALIDRMMMPTRPPHPAPAPPAPRTPDSELVSAQN